MEICGVYDQSWRCFLLVLLLFDILVDGEKPGVQSYHPRDLLVQETGMDCGDTTEGMAGRDNALRIQSE
jgi:hypothetical protein